jgi:four helix bundle protein
MRDHKSLIAWQKSRRVVHRVLEIGIHHWSPPAAAVIGQLQRSSLSVQLNIAEGHARRASSQFKYHLNVAYGSAVETIELLEILRDHSLIPATDAEATIAVAIETRALLLGLLHR